MPPKIANFFWTYRWSVAGLAGAMLLLYAAAIAFRPLMPVDETRYMTVAWEMFLRQGWLEPLTLNFQPYHHKPPLLFWMINLFWSVLGAERWAALIPPVLASFFCLILTGLLGKLLFHDRPDRAHRAMWIMAASVPFLIYGTLVMFDFTLTAFVLLALISVVLYSQDQRWRYMVALGLFLGLGVLTKGPVAYLYVLPVILLAPLWAPQISRWGRWYGAHAVALIISVIPVLFWLVPVLQASDDQFAFWLVWNQTAGRISGNFNDAHIRPFYFYLPFLPLMITPWIFLPSFWRGVAARWPLRLPQAQDRFLWCWVVPVLLAFSLISGKQAHYLLPLLPGVALAVAGVFDPGAIRAVIKTAGAVILLVVAGQAVAAHTVFNRYELDVVVGYIQSHPDQDWAYVPNYHGEFGFLARLEKPMEDILRHDLRDWFTKHPQGYAVIRYSDPQEVKDFKRIMTKPYRGRQLGIFVSQDFLQPSRQDPSASD